MKVAIASTAPQPDSQIAMHSARAPFYLIFDANGNFLEAIANPYVQVERGAAPKAAHFLDEHDVSMLVAGDFGSRFIADLEVKGIKAVQASGQVSDVISGLLNQA